MFSTSQTDERKRHSLYGATNNNCSTANQLIISSSDGTLTNKPFIYTPGIVRSDSASISAEVYVEHAEIMRNTVNSNNKNNNNIILGDVNEITTNSTSNYAQLGHNMSDALDFTHRHSNNVNNNNNNNNKYDAKTCANSQYNTRHRQNCKGEHNKSPTIQINENINESVISHDHENNNNNNNSTKSLLYHYNTLFMIVVKWWLITLLLLFLTFMVFGFIYRGVFKPIDNCNNNNSNSDSDIHHYSGKCVKPFGTMLGVHKGVFAFSNCNTEFISHIGNNIGRNSEIGDSKLHMLDAYGTTSAKYSHFDCNKHINVNSNDSTNQKYIAAFTTATVHSRAMIPILGEQYYGMKWQCVQYARRYWMLRGKPQPAYFDDVDGAADIWNLKNVHAVSNVSIIYNLKKFANGASIMSGGGAPQERDLIIYKRQDNADFVFGHVAVIVQIEWNVSKHGSLVYIAQQNWDNDLWPAPYYNYSRVLTLTYNSKVLSYLIADTTGKILGWVRYE